MALVHVSLRWGHRGALNSRSILATIAGMGRFRFCQRPDWDGSLFQMEDHDDPEHWRDRAADVRVRAAETNNQGSRCVLLGTANCYDMMAELAARRLVRLQGHADDQFYR